MIYFDKFNGKVIKSLLDNSGKSFFEKKTQKCVHIFYEKQKAFSCTKLIMKL